MILIILIILILLFGVKEGFAMKVDYRKPYYPLDRKFLNKTIKFIDQVLWENKIKYWVMMETLLGAYRDKSVIIDNFNLYQLGTFVENKDKILSLNNKLKNYQFIIKEVQVFDYETKMPKTVKNGSIDIEYKGEKIGEIYLYQIFKDGMMRNYDLETNTYFSPRLSFPEWFVHKLTRVSIDGLKYPAPRYTLRLLQHWYGSTWYIPLRVVRWAGINRNISHYLYDKYLDTNLDELMDFVRQYKLYSKFLTYFYNDYPEYMTDNVKNVGSVQEMKWMDKYEVDRHMIDEIPSNYLRT